MLELGCKSLLAYFAGSLMGALLLGQLRGVDIREVGSGNAGGTNALRTQGPWFALGVVIIDVAKGWFAVRWVPALAWPAADPELGRDWLMVACAFSVILGHVHPVWYEFRGGKGAATLLGVLATIAPAALLPVLGVWFLAVFIAGYVGLATICAGLAFPASLLLMPGLAPGSDEHHLALTSLAWVMALLIVWTHRSNLARVREGTEPHVRRLWLLGRLLARS